MSRAATGSGGIAALHIYRRHGVATARDGETGMLMMSDWFLSNAGSLFFAFWSVVISALGLAAFGPDVLPSKALKALEKRVESARNGPPAAG